MSVHELPAGPVPAKDLRDPLGPVLLVQAAHLTPLRQVMIRPARMRGADADVLLAGFSDDLHGFDLYHRRAHHVRFARR
jgi:hypothetical protein